MQVDKEVVKQRFGKKSQQYSQAASVQRSIAVKLASMIGHERNLQRILEVGCGTGFLSVAIAQLHAPKEYFLNDISREMVSATAQLLERTGYQQAVTLCGDAEQLALPTQLDAIVSASAMQWFVSPKQFLLRAANSLRPGGIVAISTFGPRNFEQLRLLTGKGLAYPSAQELSGMLPKGMVLQHCYEEVVIEPFDTAMHVLKHISNTGVNALEGAPLSCAATRQVIAEYAKRFGTSGGKVGLTYHPIWMIAKKRGE